MNEINKVNPYIVSYLIACYKYVITLTYITLSVLFIFSIIILQKIWFMNCCYEIIIYIYSRCTDIFDRLYSTPVLQTLFSQIWIWAHAHAILIYKLQLHVPFISCYLHTFTFSNPNFNLYTWTVNQINFFCLLYHRQLCLAWNSCDIFNIYI